MSRRAPAATAAAAFSSFGGGPIRRGVRGIRIVGIVGSSSTLLSPTAATVRSHPRTTSRENDTKAVGTWNNPRVFSHVFS